MPPDRVVLIGFMASGKTEVGRRLAERLGWTHVDLDEVIEAREGRSVAEIFATDGEAAFRALEVAVTAPVTERPRTVVSTGGGWITNAGVLESLPPGTLTVYLEASVDEILRRLAAAESEQAVRPLLVGGDPRPRVESLLAAREPLYRRASLTVSTDGRSPDQVARLLQQTVHEVSAVPQSSERTEHGL